MNKPLYLRTQLARDAERLDRQARIGQDYWLIGLIVFIAVIAWLIL